MIGAIEVGHVGIAILAGGSDAEFLAARDVLIKRGFLFGGQNGFLDRAIGADAHVVGAACMDGVYDVIEHVFAGGDGGRSDDLGNQIDAEISAAIGERLKDLVGLAAGMGIYGSASRMRDQDRLLRFGDAFGGGAVSAVAEVDG